jgi:hypothetical protein
VVRQDDHAIMLGDFLRRCFDRLQDAPSEP